MMKKILFLLVSFCSAILAVFFWGNDKEMFYFGIGGWVFIEPFMLAFTLSFFSDSNKLFYMFNCGFCGLLYISFLISSYVIF